MAVAVAGQHQRRRVGLGHGVKERGRLGSGDPGGQHGREPEPLWVVVEGDHGGGRGSGDEFEGGLAVAFENAAGLHVPLRGRHDHDAHPRQVDGGGVLLQGDAPAAENGHAVHCLGPYVVVALDDEAGHRRPGEKISHCFPFLDPSLLGEIALGHEQFRPPIGTPR